MKKEEEKKVLDLTDTFEIKNPLKDHEIHWNEYHKIIKEGESVTVARLFAQNMVTEGVIKELPKKG